MSGRVIVLRGDAAHLPLPDESVDSVVCDPPYALTELPVHVVAEALAAWTDGDRAWIPKTGRGGFMARSWDKFVPPPAAWDECMRALRPGGYLLAFAAPRTQDLMGMSIRLAGFEIRDSLHWLFGAGFPKGKACLKPAHEPIIMARKPGPGSAPLPGLDACRVAHASAGDLAASKAKNPGRAEGFTSGVYGAGRPQQSVNDAGRWPPNVLLGHAEGCEPAGTRRVRASAGGAGGRRFSDREYAQDAHSQAMERGERPTYADASGLETVEAWNCAPGCPVAELDRQSGPGASRGHAPARRSGLGYGSTSRGTAGTEADFGAGGASRFFPAFRYEPKADASERPRLADGTTWPTVKPVDLMRWLVRLVTPPGGTVLDLFCGTGTTGEAAILEGFSAILADKDPQALALTTVRLAKPMQPSLFGLEDAG